MKIYNTLTRKKEVFEPINKNLVGLYTCGPTVYNYAHIGNLRTYIFEDIFKRTLLSNSYKVKHIMNITDVGHLTSDEDEGEDKMDVAVAREKKTPEEIADFYANAFKEDISKLNILQPDIWCKATKHIADMVKLIQRIEKNGYSYVGKNGNVYFDTSKFKKYGDFAKLDLDNLQSGARIEIDEDKKHPRDFVLWFSTKGSKFKGHILKWNSPWGEGWPGWHIECSAMSIKYLGDTFDIHCGGIDHVSIHHTNEIAQAEAATGKKWVNYWLHGEFLIMKQGKMAKSVGDFVTLKSLTDKNYDPLAFRYMCLNTHYRKKLNFDYEGLDSARNALSTLRENIRILKETDSLETAQEKIEDYRSKFLEAINDDLNMPRALEVVWKLIREEEHINNQKKYEILLEFDKILGLDFKKIKTSSKISQEISDLIEAREEFRKKKDWKKADEARDKLLAKGIILQDTPDGITWRKKG
ncbi:cysteine--tRNA ligase [bacterium]|nr:cysteine--tRNA ligase [bacterium]